MAKALDIVGNRWSLLIVRELLGNTDRVVFISMASAIPPLAAVPAMLLVGARADKSNNRVWYTAGGMVTSAAGWMLCATVDSALFKMTGLTIAAYRRNNVTMRYAMTALAAFVATQIAIAAVLVSTFLPPVLQSAHQAVGTLVWLTVVIVAALAWRGSKYAAPVSSGDSTRSAAPARRERGALVS